MKEFVYKIPLYSEDKVHFSELASSYGISPEMLLSDFISDCFSRDKFSDMVLSYLESRFGLAPPADLDFVHWVLIYSDIDLIRDSLHNISTFQSELDYYSSFPDDAIEDGVDVGFLSAHLNSASDIIDREYNDYCCFKRDKGEEPVSFSVALDGVNSFFTSVSF